MNRTNKKSILKGGMWGRMKQKLEEEKKSKNTKTEPAKPIKPAEPTKPKSNPKKNTKKKTNTQKAGWGEEKKKTKKNSKNNKINTLVGAGWGSVSYPNKYLVGGGWGGRTRPIMIDATKLRQEKGSRFINKYFRKYF